MFWRFLVTCLGVRIPKMGLYEPGEMRFRRLRNQRRVVLSGKIHGMSTRRYFVKLTDRPPEAERDSSGVFSEDELVVAGRDGHLSFFQRFSSRVWRSVREHTINQRQLCAAFSGLDVSWSSAKKQDA